MNPVTDAHGWDAVDMIGPPAIEGRVIRDGAGCPDVSGRRPRAAQIGRAMAIAPAGLDGNLVHIEASINSGIPGIDVVGLPDASVSEAKKRVRAAISNLGIGLSKQRHTVNLSPGSLRKEGTAFDLGIAVAILAAERKLDQETDGIVFCGELGLDNRLHPVTGVLPCVVAAKAAGAWKVYVPWANEAEARIIDGIEITAAPDLAFVVNDLGGRVAGPDLSAIRKPKPPTSPQHYRADLAQVRGQKAARYGLEVAAAGGHHLLMTGSPGSGKTLLAGCLPGILPPLAQDQACRVLALRSVQGILDDSRGLDLNPPFEAPHHSATRAALLGSLRSKSVGCIARANYGVLFLDEAPEFHRDVLEALREPLDGGLLTVAQASGTVRIPGRFQLIAAANPCACGASGAPGSRCECSPVQRRRYREKLSAPWLDRIDIQLQMLPVAADAFTAGDPAESSADVAVRVARAREAQRTRYPDQPWPLNARVPIPVLRNALDLTRQETAPAEKALEAKRITMRGFDKVLRLATTIADLDGREKPCRADFLVALGLRTRDGQ